KIALKTEEAEKAKLVAEAARIEAAEKKILVEVQADNSEKVADYNIALDAQRRILSDLRAMEKAGLPVKEALGKAETELARLTRLRNDGMTDQAIKIQNKIALEKANNAIVQAGLSIQQQQYEALADQARANGDLSTSIYYEIEARKVQIQLTKAVTEAKLLEVKAARAAVEEEKKFLIATGAMTESKRLELEARLANAKAKEIEAGASAAVVAALEKEISALRNGTSELHKRTEGSRAAASASEILADRLEKEAAAEEKLAEARRKRLKIDKEGFSVDESGNRITMEMPTKKSVFEQAKSAGLSEDEGLRLADRFIGARGEQKGFAGFESWQLAVKDAIDKTVLRNAAAANRSGSPTGTAGTQTTSEAPTSKDSSTNKTVTINIGGRSQKVNVNSDADAQNLTSILRQLETQANTSS
ncbi:MAG TPA: hypothetical protein VF389_04890, partial [Woeseiaceae bacterium]